MNFVEDSLDYHRVHRAPTDIFLGELPRVWADAPAALLLNFCPDSPSGPRGDRRSISLPLHDTVEAERSPNRSELEHFLQQVHPLVHQQPSYWHCHAGINRSSFALAAYLHLYRGLSISGAIQSLRIQRSPRVLCNYSFESLLRKWYGTEAEQDFPRMERETTEQLRNKRAD